MPVQRSVSKLSEIVTAKYYGVKANGVADDGPAWSLAASQAAGRPIIAPAGTTVIQTPISYATSGESPGLNIVGQGIGKTIFDNQVAGGAMLTLDGTGTSARYALGSVLDGFSIISTTNPAGSRGIDIKGQWFGRISRFKILNLTSDGIRVINNNSDSDATSSMEFDKFWIQGSGGWGINFTDPTISSTATGHMLVKQGFVFGNTSGGIRFLGGQIGVEKSAIAGNAGVGILVPYVAASGVPNLIAISQTEFDGNTNFDIDLQACIGGKIEQCKFVYANNRTGVRMGDGGSGSVQDIKCLMNQHRRDSGTVTLYSVGSNAARCDIFDTYTPSMTGITPIVNSGSFTRYRTGGVTSLDAVATKTTTGSGSYTPNVLDATYHRVVVNAAGAFTVNAPTGGVSDGQLLELDIYNASGGAITVTFASGAGGFYSTGGYTDPANSKRKTNRFRYHAVDTKWIPVGAWSPDM